MATPLSNEIRNKIIQHKKNNISTAKIAGWLIISESAVKSIWRRYRETNCYLPSPRTQGRKPAFGEDVMRRLEDRVKEEPDITLLELIDEFNLTITEGALSKKFTKRGYSFKKRSHIQ